MHSGTVLVVEDDASIRRLLSTVLRARGYEVVEAGDGPSAVPAAHASGADVVLLDVGLPGMHGFEVLALMKADETLCDVPVLMVTAWSQPELVAKALAQGAHDFVCKPFDIAELGARVDAAALAGGRVSAPDRAERPAVAGVDLRTGLADRACTRMQLERGIAEAGRSGAPFSVVVLELDHSPPAGDEQECPDAGELLRAVTHRLQARVCRGSLLGHWDGDRFLVAAPDTGLGEATVLAEGLRWALAERPIRVGGTVLRTTVSLGVAQWDCGEPLQDLLDRCHAAVHVAQAAGRNTVRRAAAPAPPMRLVA